MKRWILKWLGIDWIDRNASDIAKDAIISNLRRSFDRADAAAEKVNMLMDYLGVELHTESEKTYIRKKKK